MLAAGRVTNVSAEHASPRSGQRRAAARAGTPGQRAKESQGLDAAEERRLAAQRLLVDTKSGTAESR